MPGDLAKGHPVPAQAGNARESMATGKPYRRARIRDAFQVSRRLPFYLRRFIPNREGQDLQATYSLLHEDGCPSTPSKSKKRTPHSELHFQKSTLRLERVHNHMLTYYSRRSEQDVLAGFAQRTIRQHSTPSRPGFTITGPSPRSCSRNQR